MNIVLGVVYDLFTNFPLMIALAAMLIAQIAKIIYYYFIEGKVNFIHFVEAGGMPSAHSAMVGALTMSVGLTFGWNNAVFAVSLILSVVVMYDAMGVRRAASKQAFMLNKLVDDIYNDGKNEIEKLKEIMGHSPVEVFAGLILGLIVSSVFYFLIYAM